MGEIISEDDFFYVHPKHLKSIREMSIKYWEGPVPKGLSLEDLQIFLVCQGFLDFLKGNSIVLNKKVVFKRE